MKKPDLRNGLDYASGQDDLTNDQMKKLLQGAELRLQGQISDSRLPEVFSESLTPHMPYKCDFQRPPYPFGC